LAAISRTRRAYLTQAGLDLPTPDYRDLPAQSGTDAGQDQRLISVVEALHAEKDFIIIDCPGSHTRLSRRWPIRWPTR
jgi:chromosome partitioning protein